MFFCLTSRYERVVFINGVRWGTGDLVGSNILPVSDFGVKLAALKAVHERGFDNESF